MRLFSLLSLVLLLVACGAERLSTTTPIPLEAIPTVDPTDTRMSTAQFNYNRNCAHCHGYGGEGQIAATVERTINLGYHLVPPHDATGHTWQHPDQLLFETIKYGVQAPTNFYPMGAFGAGVLNTSNAAQVGLSDDEIFAIIDYLRLWWTDEQQEWQAQLTDQFTENNPNWTTNRLDEVP